MLKRVSLAVLSVLLIVFIMLTFNVSGIVEQSPTHDCSGEHCVICQNSFSDKSSFELFSVIISALALFTFTVMLYGLVLKARKTLERSTDLVCLKVKLSD